MHHHFIHSFTQSTRIDWVWRTQKATPTGQADKSPVVLREEQTEPATGVLVLRRAAKAASRPKGGGPQETSD